MKRNSENCDVLILGGGIVGLTIAYQLLERDISSKIFLVERESRLGMHTSGRNSGVLHAGLYYEPKSLKAKVCVEGARRLKEWMKKKIEDTYINVNSDNRYCKFVYNWIKE